MNNELTPERFQQEMRAAQIRIRKLVEQRDHANNTIVDMTVVLQTSNDELVEARKTVEVLTKRVVELSKPAVSEPAE